MLRAISFARRASRPYSHARKRHLLADDEIKCPACDGTGVGLVKQQPSEPGKRIFPARCPKCEGKGRIKVKERD